MNRIQSKIPDVIKDNFRFGTLSFLFIIAYVNIFQFILGPQNSIVGVIFTILMSASMVRDLTATPLRHFLSQAVVLVWIAVAAYGVTHLPAPLSFVVNFITILMILYAFTYEYCNHMYFPYILSYLFLVFISPVDAPQLPGRILGMLVGAVSIMLYQWVMGRKRVVETARDVLSGLIDSVCLYMHCKLDGSAEMPDLSNIRHELCRLSQTVYDRRKKILCVSDASFSLIDAGRGVEQLLLLTHELPDCLSEHERAFLTDIVGQLHLFRAFLQQEITEIPTFQRNAAYTQSNAKAVALFEHSLVYIRDRLLHMTDPQSKVRYRKTAISLKVRMQAALDLSPVRAVYALRVALLLSCATLLIQLLGLTHGKWLVFTLASVSLPYADDVPLKIKKRVLATVIGGLCSVLLYGLVPSSAGRTAIMMLSGYLSFYLSDYKETFACSTVGALGGAVFMDTFGLAGVGGVFLIRIGYILAGVAAAYLVNCLICPFSRAKATGQLWKRYQAVTALLSSVCRSDQPDSQLYYNLVIQAHLLEEKLTENADLENWTELPAMLNQCREQVRQAHRKLIAGRVGAPVFESGHLA